MFITVIRIVLFFTFVCSVFLAIIEGIADYFNYDMGGMI